MAVYFGEWKRLVVLSVLTVAIFDCILGSAVDPADASPAMELKDQIAEEKKKQHEYRTEWHDFEPKQQDQIIDAHNQIRNDFAGQPQGAADLYVLSWDKNLRDIAEEFQWKPNPNHQADKTGSGKNLGPYTAGDFVANVNQWKVNETAGPQNLPEMTAQILWAGTRNIYCLRVHVRDGDPEVFSCAYDVGSVAGQPAYQVGTPCTACKCDAKWNNLCAVEEAGGPGSGLAVKLAVSTWLCLGCSLAVWLL